VVSVMQMGITSEMVTNFDKMSFILRSESPNLVQFPVDLKTYQY